MSYRPSRTLTRTLVAVAAMASAITVSSSSVSVAEAPDTSSDTAAAAAAPQRVLFSYTGVQSFAQYWEPRPAQPSSYTSPVNYAGGHFYLKLDVLSKPSNKAMIPQVCMWRHGAKKFQYETCSSTKMSFTSKGTYWIDLGAPAGWWKKAGGYDWSKQASVMRIMLKDPATKKLFLSSKCGAACYRGGDLAQHVPVQMRAELIMVPKGSTLAPPANWGGCPGSWSPRC